ncbi:legumain-like isoform X2 [Megalops cyprinoides]|uniref:legumain-like isoform X2 n=1 Tax=Megalops cyprinoides TaxID=118141 RepID=UPI001863FAE2|nr:legumain-like isoform X2 [Megalops cyprinoides]
MLTVICVEVVFHLMSLVASSVGDLSSAMEVKDCVPNPDARVAVMQRRIQSAGSPAEKEKLERELHEHMQTREAVRASVIQVIEKATDSKEQALHVQSATSVDITNPKMYKEVVEYYKVKCFNWHEPKYEFAMHFMHLFANLCREQTSLERIKSAIDDVSESLKREDVS